jgi:ABC-2 type transport system ATP-binding protein
VIITAHSLTKRYGAKTAVDGLTFEVPPGVVTGFLGPNGSGKSTTMRMIIGLDAPDAGTALIGGRRCAELGWPLREVGGLLEAKAFHPARTARNHLRWLALSNDIPVRRVDEVLDQVGLTSVANRRPGKFSLGMSRRLGLAATLLGDPAVLLFDEPVNGLDPEGIRWVRRFLRGLAAEGQTVFVSSHLISEMAQTADRLVVIGRGRLIAETSVADFVTRSGGGAVRLVTPDTAAFAAVLAAAGAKLDEQNDHTESLTVAGLTAAQIGDLAAREGLRVHELIPVTASLEDAFMELTRDDVEFRRRRWPARLPAGRRSDDDDPGGAEPAGRYRVRHAVRSEIVKMLTLRSTAVMLGITVVAALLVTGLVTKNALHQPRPFYFGFDPTQQSLTGLIVAGLTAGVFGALLITGEYSSGTIRMTLAATPKRPVALAAKLGVTAATVVFSLLLSFAAFGIGQAILAGGGAPSAGLGSPGALRAVLLTGLFIALLALMSFGFGLVLRSTAGAIAAFAGVVFVLPLVMHGISEPDVRYVPTNILTNSIMSTSRPLGGPGGVGPLSPGIGFLLMASYAAIPLVVGAVLFGRRDA